MRAYQDMVYSTAVRLTGSDPAAQDISQAVFLKAYEHFGMLRASPCAGGWLKTVATRLTLNHLRRYRNRWRFFSELQSHADEEGYETSPLLDLPAPEVLLEELDDDRRRALLEQVLAALPDHQRIPLVLFHFQEMSYEQIAAELGIAVSKVRADIHRGRRALAAQLARRGLAGASV